MQTRLGEEGIFGTAMVLKVIKSSGFTVLGSWESQLGLTIPRNVDETGFPEWQGRGLIDPDAELR